MSQSFVFVKLQFQGSTCSPSISWASSVDLLSEDFYIVFAPRPIADNSNLRCFQRSYFGVQKEDISVGDQRLEAEFWSLLSASSLG